MRSGYVFIAISTGSVWGHNHTLYTAYTALNQIGLRCNEKTRHLDEDFAVEGVHDGQWEVEVEDAGDDLQCSVGGVLSVTDVRRHDPTTFVDEMMPTDNRYDPQWRHRPYLEPRWLLLVGFI